MHTLAMMYIAWDLFMMLIFYYSNKNQLTELEKY